MSGEFNCWSVTIFGDRDGDCKCLRKIAALANEMHITFGSVGVIPLPESILLRQQKNAAETGIPVFMPIPYIWFPRTEPSDLFPLLEKAGIEVSLDFFKEVVCED